MLQEKQFEYNHGMEKQVIITSRALWGFNKKKSVKKTQHFYFLFSEFSQILVII